MQLQDQHQKENNESHLVVDSVDQEQAINQLVAERHENTTRMLEADSDCV